MVIRVFSLITVLVIIAVSIFNINFFINKKIDNSDSEQTVLVLNESIENYNNLVDSYDKETELLDSNVKKVEESIKSLDSLKLHSKVVQEIKVEFNLLLKKIKNNKSIEEKDSFLLQKYIKEIKFIVNES